MAKQYADAAASVGTGGCNAIQAANAVALAELEKLVTRDSMIGVDPAGAPA